MPNKPCFTKLSPSLLANCLLASCLLISGTATAEIGPILITPTRTAQSENITASSVTVITQQDIKDSGSNNLSDLLRRQAGIQLSDLFGDGSSTVIGMRGFSSSANANILVLVNGRRLNHSDTHGPDINHVFIKDIERIEIINGSAGSLYGDQAVGGVINIILKTTREKQRQISVETGSNGLAGTSISLSDQVSDTFSYRVSAEAFKSNNYRDHNDRKNNNLYGSLTYESNNHTTFIEHQRIDDKLELPGALIQSEYDLNPKQINSGFANDFQNSKTSLTHLNYNYLIARNNNFSIDFTNRKTDASVLQSFRNSPSPAAGYANRDTVSVNPKFYGTFNSTGTDINYVVGIDVEKNKYDLSLPNVFNVSASSNDQDTQSIYGQMITPLSEKSSFVFGARASSVDNDMKDSSAFPSGITFDDDVFVTELGLVFKPNASTKLTLRRDENFRFAKVNENAVAASGNILKTQEGVSTEAGLELKGENTTFTALIYQLTLDNEIAFDPIINKNINFDDTVRNGINLTLNQNITSSLMISGNLSYVDAKFSSGTVNGNKIPGVADTIFSLRTDYRINKNHTIWLEGIMKNKHFAQGDNANAQDKAPGYSVIHIGSNYGQDNWDIEFRVNNLFDKKYAEFVTNNGFGAAYQPSPERNYRLAVNYPF